MAIKLMDVPVTTTTDNEDQILVYDSVTEQLTRITPGDLVISVGGGEANVQVDWNETNNTLDSYILNKPSLSLENQLSVADYTTQSPTGETISDAITIAFGAGGTTTDGDITVDGNGVLTINNTLTAQYILEIELRVSRSSAIGIVDVIAWEEISTDGGSSWAQPASSFTQVVQIDSKTTTNRELANVYLSPGILAGTKFRFRFGRDVGGFNQGDLSPFVPAGTYSSLNTAPSAYMTIRKLV